MKDHTSRTTPSGFAYSVVLCGGLMFLVLWIHGCSQAPQGQVSRPLESAFRDAPTEEPAVPPAHLEPASAGSDSASDVIVTVDGQPVSRQRVVNLLLAGNGPGILEQIVVYTSARRMLDERGLRISQVDIDREYENALKKMVTSEGPFDRQAAESILQDILNRRNISEAEYRLAMERNACLRALVRADISFTEQQIREEFERLHGTCATARHIQVGSMAQAQKIRSALDQGEDFAELARRHSANPNSALDGGALRPFTRSDLDVPPLMRETVFSMQPGEISNPIVIEGWYHILKLESLEEADSKDFTSHRSEAERSLRDRLTEAAMQQLYRKLYEQADIEIKDPVLRDAVKKRQNVGSGR